MMYLSYQGYKRYDKMIEEAQTIEELKKVLAELVYDIYAQSPEAE